jgi:CBS domain-containing protein
MQVREVMTADPACCTPDTVLSDIALLMIDNDCGEIPVVDDLERRHLVGVVTDRDIVCRAVAEGKSPTDTTAADVMTDLVVTVREDADLDDCCKKMETHQVRRVPVVDEGGGCCGIVAQADIV